jgi:hypothetical protein
MVNKLASIGRDKLAHGYKGQVVAALAYLFSVARDFSAPWIAGLVCAVAAAIAYEAIVYLLRKRGTAVLGSTSQNSTEEMKRDVYADTAGAGALMLFAFISDILWGIA